MGDEGAIETSSASPPAKRLKRVAEMVMVLSAMAEIRGGRDPTPAEKAMVAEARESLTSLCERLKPKDLFPREAIRALVEDLGLNRDSGLAFRPPRLSIADKVLHTKRKMEAPKDFGMNQSLYTSQHIPSGFHTTTPVSSSNNSVSLRKSHIHEKAVAVTPGVTATAPSLAAEAPHLRHDTRHNGPNYLAQTRAQSPSGLPKPEQKSKSQQQAPARLAGAPHRLNCEQPSKKSSASSPIQVGPTNLLIGLPAPQGIAFVPAHSILSSHADISKKVERIVLELKRKDHPEWTPPSTEYMNKPVACQLCRTVITDTESLILCDACEKGYHLRCLQMNDSKMVVPKAEWHCQRCLAASHGKPLPPKYGRVTRTVAPPKSALAASGAHDPKKGVPNGIILPLPLNPSQAQTQNGACGDARLGNGDDGRVTANGGVGVPVSGGGARVDWVSDIMEKVEGKSYYKSCCVDGVVYKLGDCVLVLYSDGCKPAPSKIQSLWESNESKWAAFNSYYLSTDLPESVSASSGGAQGNEVYASDNQRVTAAGSIQGKCEVLTIDKYREESERRNQLAGTNIKDLPPIFMCRWKYDESNRILKPFTS